MKKTLFYALVILFAGSNYAQEYFPKNNGVKEKNTNYKAFKNAKIYVTPTRVLENATLLIRDGKVVDVGTNVTIPENSIVSDLSGMSVYPSFIDPYTDFGVKKPERAEGQGRSPQYESKRDGYYWNEHIMPENRAMDKFKYDTKKAEGLRKAGFGIVNTHLMDGIARGTGVLLALNDEDDNAVRILEDDSGQYFSFEKSVASRQSYPTSLMGAMALLRQLHYDLEWYEAGNSKTKDRSLEALIANKALPAFFEAGSKSNNLRADKIGDMFNRKFIIVGGGDEYEMINESKATEARFIIPVNFPDAYDVSDPYAAKYISLEDMRNWNQAPSNPKTLAENGVVFALTTYELESAGDFMGKIRKALEYGLDDTAALTALTITPASFLGKSDMIGTLEKGKLANFLVTSGEVFDKDTEIYENWVQGRKHIISDKDQKDIRGKYKLNVDGKTFDLEISGEKKSPSAEIKFKGKEYPAKLTYTDNWMAISFSDAKKVNRYRTTAVVSGDSDNLTGLAVLPSGEETSFSAVKTGKAKKDKKDKKDKSKTPEMVSITYPNVGYGFKSKPAPENILFRNATVWTGEAEGILENTDVLVTNGKISSIGKGLNAGGAKVIDATGKHLTAGIIDEHSHIATLSTNEAGHNSSAEVSIEDVVDPEDVSIYRNLAGGVTSIQILHGSANPIGGRSAIIKLKWGTSADEMIYDESPKFIKFALGENVKQSNWESYSRFPQTRMGVEQVFVNYFNRAKEYEAKKKSGEALRYDEEMEVLVEILNGERFISCHSYVQSEINMLMKVAERFGFRVNTFTHILEGYKVADKMKEHGVGGSTFSDWWAYKYEVNDAIPYNAAIMASEGVVVAINSDDGEMSRRLNQEAAKSVKYGGMSEEEAWKMVTINPAKLLHLDERTGSIKAGKDADLVLWNNHPLSVYAKAEKTMIDGTVYFDIDKDQQMRKAIQEERSKLINMMLDEKNGGGKTKAPYGKDKRFLTCESLNYN